MSRGALGGVTQALGYLLWRSLVNRARRLGRQLRSPRYAVAVLVGAGYLGLVFAGQRHQPANPVIPDVAIELGGSLFLLILLAKWWLLGADRQALAFSPAELHFLLPAPVTRRTLLAFKLVRAQVPVLLNVVLWTVLLGRSDSRLPAPAYAIAVWLLFTILFLHRLGVALVRDAVTGHRAAGVRRVLPALAGLAAGAAVIGMGLARAWQPAMDALAGGPGGIPTALRIVAGSAPLSWILLPFRLLMQPLGADALAEWLVRLPFALGVLGLHLVWVFRAERAFEESAVAASAAQARELARRDRPGQEAMGPPTPGFSWLRLAPDGHPVSAIVWKNLLRLLRTTSGAVPLIILMGIAILSASVLLLSGRTAAVTAVASLCLAWGLALIAFGPLLVRNDLRAELDRLALLKSWPLPGDILVAGYVASSALVLTLLQVVLGGLALAGMMAAGQVSPAVPVLLGGVAPALLLLAMVNTVAIGLQHGAALLFPAWVRLELRPGGIEALGQQFLTMGAALLLLALALLGPGTLAGGVWWLLSPALGGWAIPPALGVAAVALGVEGFLLLDWLGDRFDRLDPSAAV